MADDHVLVRAGIRALLEKLPGVEVVGEASDGRGAVELAQAHAPDVALLDLAMPGLNGLEATRRIAAHSREIAVIILSIHNNEEYVWQAFKSGASGYILKKAATDELEAAIQKVMAGEIYLSPEISVRRQDLQGRENVEPKTPLDQLTSRQREILQLIAEGRNTKEIAFILKVSTKTVEYHRTQLMDRLNIHDIPGLVRFAMRVGLIHP